MIFDTHTHYDDERYDGDREEVLSSLSSFGVKRICNIAADMASCETTLSLALSHDFVYAALGVHPDGSASLTEADMTRLKELLKEPKAVAVGEIGLDYYYDDGLPHELQKKWFERQLELSEEVGKPVVIHSRDAAKDTYDILKSLKTGDGAGIMHCFSYSKEMARQFLDLGYYIALGGVVTFKNARNAKEVAAYVPEDRLLLETDCPYMAPVPFRGKRNSSQYLPYVVTEIAAIRGITEERLMAATYENANRLFRIPDSV